MKTHMWAKGERAPSAPDRITEFHSTKRTPVRARKLAAMAVNHLASYQSEALKTAAPVALTLPYLIPGIVGEVGELFGHRAKALWHETPVPELMTEQALEYGDICWMTAVLLSVYKISEVPRNFYHPHARWWGGPENPWLSLLRNASSLFQWFSEEQTTPYIKDTACDLWVSLERESVHITGRHFDEVLAMNISKLRSREERGTLVGNGDHR